ncbi:MAG: hypothetical protein HFJ50_07875 [Clostridia bacterium]|jgi:uncharacterized Zn-finger protein|nr:hypothetical protein [Clostridia bacterium]
MANLKKKFNAIMADLESNIKNQEDMEYIKSQVYNIALLFLDEIDNITELSLDRMNVMLEREKELAHKVTKMERALNNLEKEVFVSQEGDFEIICPYCNAEFLENLNDDVEHEIKCPECGNVIELDWHEEEECTHNCSGGCTCNHSHEEDDYDEEDENGDEEDDM